MARVSAFQAEGCGFETRLPLQNFEAQAERILQGEFQQKVGVLTLDKEGFEKKPERTRQYVRIFFQNLTPYKVKNTTFPLVLGKFLGSCSSVG